MCVAWFWAAAGIVLTCSFMWQSIRQGVVVSPRHHPQCLCGLGLLPGMSRHGFCAQHCTPCWALYHDMYQPPFVPWQCFFVPWHGWV